MKAKRAKTEGDRIAARWTGIVVGSATWRRETYRLAKMIDAVVKRAENRTDMVWWIGIHAFIEKTKRELHGAPKHNADQWRQCLALLESHAREWAATRKTTPSRRAKR